MKGVGILRQLVISVLLIMALLSPVLIATVPTTNTNAQSNLNSVEKASQNSIALGNLFSKCTVITKDGFNLSNKDTLVGCIQELVSTVFILAVLWVIISIAANLLGFVIRSGEGGGDGPVKMTRKKIENSLIGLFLVGAPFLLISLFATNLGSTNLLYNSLDPVLVDNCSIFRKKLVDGTPSVAVAKYYTDEIEKPFVINKKNSTKIIQAGGGSYGEYAINIKYILSDFCVGKVDLAAEKAKLTKLLEAINKTSGLSSAAQLASSKKMRNTLASITVVPSFRTVEELQTGIQTRYDACIKDLPSMAVFCAVVKTSAEVSGFGDSQLPNASEERASWIIFTGRLYQVAFADEQLGGAVADALILSIESGKLDTKGVKAAVGVATTMIQNQEYKNTSDPFQRDLHLQRLAYVSGSVARLLDNPQVDNVIAANAIGFVSTFILTNAPTNDTERSFVALKTALVGNTMNFLIANDYSTKSIASLGFKTLTESLRGFGKEVESELVARVGEVANDYLVKLEAQSNGTYLVTEYDKQEAALDLGLYVVDIAIKTNQDLDSDGRLGNVVRIGGAFGKEIVKSEINCSQDIFAIGKLVSSLKLIKLALKNASNTNLKDDQQLYNKEIGDLRQRFNNLSNKTDFGEPNDDTLIGIMNEQSLIRPGLINCKGVESPRLLTLTYDLVKAALPSTTPAIAGAAIDFAYNTARLVSDSSVSDTVKKDYISLGLLEVSAVAVTYLPKDDKQAAVIGELASTSITITRSYLELSISCKNSLETIIKTSQTSESNIRGIQYDWSGIYERFVKGVSTEDDLKILKSDTRTQDCLGLKNSQIVEAGFGAIKNIYVIAAGKDADPRIADLIDPSRNDSVSYFVISTMKDMEGGKVYPQNLGIRAISTGLYVIKNFSDSPNPAVIATIESVSRETVTLLEYSINREKTCDEYKKNNSNSTDTPECKGLNEFDFTRAFLGVIKDVVQIQGPGSQFFATILTETNKYVDELQAGSLTNPKAALGILEVANSGTQAIFASIENKTDITDAERSNIAFGRSLSGKAFSITKNYLTVRERCDASVADVVYRVRNKQTLTNPSLLPSVYTKQSIQSITTEVKDEEILISNAVNYNISLLRTDRSSSSLLATFKFTESEQINVEKIVLACADTVSLETAKAAVDLVVEFVKIPGFPMEQAADLADYLINVANNIENYSDYKTGQYIVRLVGAVINENACTPKEGEKLSTAELQNREKGCKAVGGLVTFVDRTLQLYIDGKVTNPNFARELLRLGHNLAITFGADETISAQVSILGEKIVTLWEKSIAGDTKIFNEKTVAAEFLNFASAVLPYVIKTDKYTTKFLQTWTDLAADALRAPDSINASTALKATASFISSKLWQCDAPNLSSEKQKACDNNIGADVAVFMGVLDSINIGPVSKEKYINLCTDSVGNNVCGPQIEKQISNLEGGIKAGNKNAFRQANAVLNYKDGNNVKQYNKVIPNQLGQNSFSFSRGGPTQQYELLQKNISVCESVGVADDVENPQDQEEALKNDKATTDTNTAIKENKVSNNQCLRNPMIQLTASLSLNLDSLVDSVLYGLSGKYGSIGIGENKIVATLAKVLIDVDINRLVVGDTSTIGRTVVRNIGYVLRGLPIEQLTGDGAAKVIRMVGDLPWETIVYNPLALGGSECALPAKPLSTVPQQNLPQAPNPSTETVFYPGRIVVRATQVGYKGLAKQTKSDAVLAKVTTVNPNPVQLGVDEPAKANLTPACTAAVATGILSRIDFSLLFSVIGNETNGGTATDIGKFVNTAIGILDRMDFSCPLGTTLDDGTCDQSAATVTKSVITILGNFDIKFLTENRVAQFVKKFVENLPTDVFVTGFSLSQMDKWVVLTGFVAEELGVSAQDIKTFKETYNFIAKILRDASQIIKTISNILKYVDEILGYLANAKIGPNILGIDIDSLRSFVKSVRQLIDEIRKITDQFDQLKEVKIGYTIEIRVFDFANT
jgi:hypothetical protein